MRQIIKSFRNRKAGFTLIELLVVMAIIGILAALSLTSFNTAQKNSRDTRRKSDLQQYRNALEAYASNNSGKYPLFTYCRSNEACSPPGNLCIFDGGAEPNTSPLINEYLPSKINDVMDCSSACEGGNCVYKYYSSLDGTWYSLVAALETGGHWEVCSAGKSR